MDATCNKLYSLHSDWCCNIFQLQMLTSSTPSCCTLLWKAIAYLSMWIMSCYHLICRSHTAWFTRYSAAVGGPEGPRYLWHKIICPTQGTLPPSSGRSTPLPYPTTPTWSGGVSCRPIRWTNLPRNCRVFGINWRQRTLEICCCGYRCVSRDHYPSCPQVPKQQLFKNIDYPKRAVRWLGIL